VGSKLSKAKSNLYCVKYQYYFDILKSNNR